MLLSYLFFDLDIGFTHPSTPNCIFAVGFIEKNILCIIVKQIYRAWLMKQSVIKGKLYGMF
jgi:hypothetical protein